MPDNAGGKAPGVRQGEDVVAIKDFGGIVREAVPAGTPGRVVRAPVFGPAEVVFTIDDFWRGRREVTVQVQPDEVAPVRD